MFEKSIQRIRMVRVGGIILLVGLALFLRFHDLDDESLWMDEIRQVSYYTHSFHRLIHDAATQNQPPLDYWIGRILYVFSDTDFSVRVPSAIFGTGSILFIYLLISELVSRAVAFGAGIIAAFLPFNIYYAQEARPYTIAVFFFVGQLWFLLLLLKTEKRNLTALLFFLIFTTGFLLSRTLSPLVTNAALFLILTGWFMHRIWREGFSGRGIQDRILLAQSAILISFLLYFPFLEKVLSMGGRYVLETTMISLDTLVQGLRLFSIRPLWQTYMVQTDPLGFPLLFLLLFVPLAVRLQAHKRWMFGLFMFLLPVAALGHFFLYHAKITVPFRPSYAVYLLPLVVILSSAVYQAVWDASGGKRLSRPIRTGLILAAAALLFLSSHSAFLSKGVRKKTDWRGLTTYLEKHYDEKSVLIFDSLYPHGRWEPTFYGFPRYYDGCSSRLPLAMVPRAAEKMIHDSREPVFILFVRRNIYLTPRSRYPINPDRTPSFSEINFEKIVQDPFWHVLSFTGFLVIRNKFPTHNLAEDARAIITRLLHHLPQNSSVIQLRQAQKSLAMASQSKHGRQTGGS
jgi:4-amino-4-deoxy-L-arabinose transferase-like glycosyltransferase